MSEKYKKNPLRKFLKTNIIPIGFVLVLLGLYLIMNFAQISSNSHESEFSNGNYSGDNVVNLYYFHLKTCPHCIEQNKFMKEELFKQYPNVNLISYEMSDPASFAKYVEFANKIDGLEPTNFPGTPLTIIGNQYNIGFGTAQTSGVRIIEMIENYNGDLDLNTTTMEEN